jgi:Tfp pilus assembly protein PilN
MRAVNLLPRQHVERSRKREKTNPLVPVAGIGSAIVVLALAGGFLLANRSVDRQRQALADAKAQLAATPATKLAEQTQAFRAALLSQREERSLALAAALGQRVSWDRILRHITLVMPGDVWLTSLQGTVPLQASSPATSTAPSALPSTPTALTIVGSTYSQDGVARLLERLDVLPDLTNVQLQSSQSTQVGSQTVINFSIVADVRKGRGAS